MQTRSGNVPDIFNHDRHETDGGRGSWGDFAAG